MPLTKIGINITGMQNVSAPEFTMPNSTEEFFSQVPQKANEVTQGWLGFTVLAGLFFYLLWKLNQASNLGGDYGFSVNRSIGIAAAICSVLGLYCLNMGYFVNFYHVAVFVIAAFIMAGIVWWSQR